MSLLAASPVTDTTLAGTYDVASHNYNLPPRTQFYPENDTPALNKQKISSARLPWAMSIELVQQLIYDHSLPDGSASNASISLRKRLAARDPGGEALTNFLEKYPDPAAWLCQQFPSFKRCDVRQYCNPLGVSFHVEGLPYADFILREGIRVSKDQPISVGVTLTLASMPLEYYNLFVVVNCGDGSMGARSATEIELTDRHEKLHLAFNRFFRQQRQLGLGEVSTRLNNIKLDDINSHYALAGEIAMGNAEFARSEVVSYASQGNLFPEELWVRGTYWEKYFENINQYLDKQNATASQRQAVMSCYNGYFAGYEEYVEKCQSQAREIFSQSGPARLEEKLVHLLYYTPELKFRLHSLVA